LPLHAKKTHFLALLATNKMENLFLCGREKTLVCKVVGNEKMYIRA
jgi:hypothetical protein